MDRSVHAGRGESFGAAGQGFDGVVDGIGLLASDFGAQFGHQTVDEPSLVSPQQVTVQGKGRMNKLTLDCPKLIRFHDLTEDEVFCPESTARAGVTFENTSTVEPLVVLRYFGPEANPDAPAMGAYRKNG